MQSCSTSTDLQGHHAALLQPTNQAPMAATSSALQQLLPQQPLSFSQANALSASSQPTVAATRALLQTNAMQQQQQPGQQLKNHLAQQLTMQSAPLQQQQQQQPPLASAQLVTYGGSTFLIQPSLTGGSPSITAVDTSAMGGQKPLSADPSTPHPQLTVDANGQLSLTGEQRQKNVVAILFSSKYVYVLVCE